MSIVKTIKNWFAPTQHKAIGWFDSNLTGGESTADQSAIVGSIVQSLANNLSYFELEGVRSDFWQAVAYNWVTSGNVILFADDDFFDVAVSKLSYKVVDSNQWTIHRHDMKTVAMHEDNVGTVNNYNPNYWAYARNPEGILSKLIAAENSIQSFLVVNSKNASLNAPTLVYGDKVPNPKIQQENILILKEREKLLQKGQSAIIGLGGGAKIEYPNFTD